MATATHESRTENSALQPWLTPPGGLIDQSSPSASFRISLAAVTMIARIARIVGSCISTVPLQNFAFTRDLREKYAICKENSENSGSFAKYLFITAYYRSIAGPMGRGATYVPSRGTSVPASYSPDFASCCGLIRLPFGEVCQPEGHDAETRTANIFASGPCLVRCRPLQHESHSAAALARSLTSGVARHGDRVLAAVTRRVRCVGSARLSVVPVPGSRWKFMGAALLCCRMHRSSV